MAKRKRPSMADVANTVSEAVPPKPEPKAKPKKSGRLKRKTVLMTDELIARVETMAEQHGVGINEMHRWLLVQAMDMVDDGTLTVEAQQKVISTLGV